MGKLFQDKMVHDSLLKDGRTEQDKDNGPGYISMVSFLACNDTFPVKRNNSAE